MIAEITSFNEMFSHARRLGLRLNSFHELPSGVFAANWRIDGDRPWFGPVAEHAQPFTAAHNALVLADLQMPKVAAAKETADLFE